MRDEIEILSGIDAVRQNPWMYIGSVCEAGAHHLLYELVHNSVDEALLGFCTKIRVTLDGNFCEVEDNGRGIPTEQHSQAGISSCEIALTHLHAGSKFQKKSEQFIAGMHGVGLSCVNALSSVLEVTVDRKGKRFEQHYKKGVPEFSLREAGVSDLHGTRIRFSPDLSIFRGFLGFQESKCRDFLENLSFLVPGLEIKFQDLSQGREVVYCNRSGGLSAFLGKFSAGQKTLFSEPIALTLRSEGLQFDALFYWTVESGAVLPSFVNCVQTVHGGTHLNAFRAGLVRGVNRMMLETGKSSWKGSPAEVEEVTDGLLGLINCRVARPNFEGQTKSRFTNTEVISSIEQVTADQIYDYFRANPKVASLVFDRIHDTRNARLAARRATDRIYYQRARKEINEEVYKEQFGARSKNWHDSAVWITHKDLLQSHSDLYQMGEDAVALDVCCGSGVVGASFRQKVKKVIGLDLTPEMVNLAKERLDEVHQGNVYHLPFADNSFDLVCTREVLHLLPYPERPVSEIFRVLKPGGQFIVGQILPFSEDDAPWMYRIFKKKQPLIFNMFQEEDFRRLLHSPGFVEMEMKELNVWESIDIWINSYETTAVHRHEIRELFQNAPAEARVVHPFKILPSGEIQDLWRWCVFSVRKPR